MHRGLDLAQSKKLLKFDQVRAEVAAAHDLKNPDQTIEMSQLRITPQLNIEVPRMGTFSMTLYAQRQLGAILGVNWGRWFDSSIVSHEDIQSEIQKRFSATGDQRKLRTNRFREGDPGVPGCDGYLRAVLTPTYFPIDDERIFDRLERKFGSRVGELNFMKGHLARQERWGNDHCNHYTLVGDPVNMGPIDRNHSDPRVREVYNIAEQEGQLPENDLVYPGFNIKNSEVGYSAIIIDEFSFRLVCLNGMMITTGDSRLMYRQHRPIEDTILDKQLGEVFSKVPARWEATRRQLNTLQEMQLEDAEKVIQERLKKLDAPKHFREAAAAAFGKEPLQNMYGVVQAVTRAAQEYDDMDKRYEFEALAGRIFSRPSA